MSKERMSFRWIAVLREKGARGCGGRNAGSKRSLKSKEGRTVGQFAKQKKRQSRRGGEGGNMGKQAGTGSQRGALLKGATKRKKEKKGGNLL